jgi:fumarate reductase flavoprotein subunit
LNIKGEEIMGSSISRRNFIKGSAVSVLGAGALGLTGCAPKSIATPTTEPAAVEQPTQAAKLPDLSGAKYDVDVVVVGSGAAGMAAAIEAADKGLKTILLEVNSTLGGNANYAEGIFGFHTKYQQAKGLSYDANEMVKGDIDYSHYRADYRLIKEFILGADENIQWLEDMGMTFYDQLGGAKYATQHLYKGKGMAMINDVMKPRAEKLGVTILTSTRGKELYMQDGKVQGILAEGADGEFPIKAKAIVLACGGFIQNDQMVKEQTQYDPNRMIVTATPNHVGDGIKMAYSAGGDTTGAKLFHLIWAGVDGIPFKDEVSVAACNEPYFWVNADGVRFVSEGLVAGKVTETCNAILNQKKVYSILSQGEINRLMKEPCTVGWGSYVFQGTVMQNIQKQLDDVLAKNPKNVYTGATIEELANKMGLDPKTLSATVQNYNAICDAGVDTDFGKDKPFLRKVETGPFYAFELKCNVFCSMGGIRVNTRNEVLDSNFNPIPGLYGAGVDCSGLYGDTYCIDLAGSAQGYAVYSGRNSARSIKTYLQG